MKGKWRERKINSISFWRCIVLFGRFWSLWKFLSPFPFKFKSQLSHFIWFWFFLSHFLNFHTGLFPKSLFSTYHRNKTNDLFRSIESWFVLVDETWLKVRDEGGKEPRSPETQITLNHLNKMEWEGKWILCVMPRLNFDLKGDWPQLNSVFWRLER